MATTETEAGTTAREPMPMADTGPCWVCGGSRRQRVWADPFDLSDFPGRFGKYAHAEHRPTWVVKCLDCGFAQPESLPAVPDFFDVLYDIRWGPDSLDREFETGYKDFIFRGVLDGLSARLAPGMPRTVLDVGTHVGRFLHLAREAGWEAEGIELGPQTSAYAAERTGLPVHRGRAQDLVERGRTYAAVTMTDVLEHIPNPAPLVAELRKLLQPGGAVAIKVPSGAQQRLKEGIRRRVLGRADAGVGVRFVHVNHFTPGSLRRCLEGAGFREVRVEVGAPEIMPETAGRTAAEAKAARDRMLAYRLAKALPGGVHTPLAMNLQAFAVNPKGPA